MSFNRQHRKGIEWYLWAIYQSFIAMDKDGRRAVYEFIVSLVALYLVGTGKLGGSIAGTIVVTTMGLDVPKLAEAYKQVKLEAAREDKA